MNHTENSQKQRVLPNIKTYRDKLDDFSSLSVDTNPFFTPLDEAIAEIKRRRVDSELAEKVKKYLNNDIPKHFLGSDPILYLARHVATPNYEALRFIEMTKGKKLPVVIGQDRCGIFTPKNPLKRALGKLPIVKGLTRNNDEILENFTIINFETSQGKRHDKIKTCFNENLVTFHNNLFNEVGHDDVLICEECDWIDTNYRSDLEKQYEHMLALTICHGIMFESFPPEELGFVERILQPAFNHVQETFGKKPLIVELIDNNTEMQRNWNSYPKELYPHIKNKFNQLHK